MGLKSVRKNKKPTTEPPPPPPSPPPPTKSPSSSSDDEDNNAAVSATSSSPTSSSNADLTTATPTVPTSVKYPPPSSSSEEESDDDDDSPPPEKTPSSKPVAATPISSKRPAESETVSGSEKRVKKDVSPAVATTAQKQLFQRLWSDEDEIVILKGILDYKAKKGVDPMVNIEDFLSFVKNSLVVVDVNKRQLKDKIFRLKKRFLNAQKKKLSDPHEIKIFEISKKIWGKLLLVDDDEDDSLENDDDYNKKGSNGVVEVRKGKEVKRSGVREEEGVEWKGNLGNLGSEFGFLGEDGAVLKEVMKNLGEGERGEVNEMVKKANAAYLEAYLLRLKVLEVAAKKMLDGFKKD